MNSMIETLGYTSWYIESKREEFEERLKEIATDNLMISMDVQGPLTRLVDAGFFPWWGVATSLHFLESRIKEHIPIAINSGWDLSTLMNFRDKRLGNSSINLIGEDGAVYLKNNKINEVNPISKDVYLKMLRNVVENAAEENLKIAFQGNFSKRVSCIYIEGDAPERGGIRNHFLVKGSSVSTEDIYNTIKKKDNNNLFGFDGEYIEFEPEGIAVLDEVMRKRYPLQSIRLKKKNGKLYFKRDDRDKEDFTLDDMIDFFEKNVPNHWKIDINPDYNADIIYIGDGNSPTKETTANILGKDIFGDEDFAITHIGDKPGDVFTNKNAIFFAQYGTPAHKYCEENNIPHIPIISAVDYLLTITNYLARRGN